MKEKNEMKEKIEQAWQRRAASIGYKPGYVAYRKAEVEFFTGAMAAINAIYPNEMNPDAMSVKVPPIWIINIMSGRPVV